MANQNVVPVYPDDHDCFKQIAAKEKKSMKDLFHEWIDDHRPKENGT